MQLKGHVTTVEKLIEDLNALHEDRRELAHEYAHASDPIHRQIIIDEMQHIDHQSEEILTTKVQR